MVNTVLWAQEHSVLGVSPNSANYCETFPWYDAGMCIQNIWAPRYWLLISTWVIFIDRKFMLILLCTCDFFLVHNQDIRLAYPWRTLNAFLEIMAWLDKNAIGWNDHSWLKSDDVSYQKLFNIHWFKAGVGLLLWHLWFVKLIFKLLQVRQASILTARGDNSNDKNSRQDREALQVSIFIPIIASLHDNAQQWCGNQTFHELVIKEKTFRNSPEWFELFFRHQVCPIKFSPLLFTSLKDL